MKRGLIVLVQVLMLVGIAFAQVPSTVPFQAVVRDASANLLLNQAVCVQLTVQGPPPGNAIKYQETQTISTNQLGLLNLNVGAGTPNLTYASSLAGVNWGAGVLYMDISMDVTGTCSAYTHMGAAQIMSVPYAIYAGSASSVSGAAGSDLSGNYPNPSVVQIQGVGVTATPAPVTGQVLEFNGSYWTPATTIGNTTNGTTLTGLNVGIKGATSVNGSGGANTTVGSTSSTTTVAGPAAINDGLTETGNIAITTAAAGAAVINDPSPSPSAVLDLYSTTQGFLPPRVTTAQEAAISNPANGLMVYNTTTKCLDIAHGGIWESIYCNCPNLSSLNAISGNTTVCSGTTNTYSVQSVQGASSYTWSVTGSPTITGNGTSTISFSAPSLTAYTVSVTAVNACASSSVNQSVVVNDFTGVPTTPTWTSAPAASVCTGATIGYAINSSETGVNGTSAQNYTWNISATGSATAVVNGQTVSSSNPLVFSNTTTTSYSFVYGSGLGTITASIAGNNTCGTGTALTQTITVDAQPALTNPTPASQTVCTNGTKGAISTTPSGGTGTITYQWYSNVSNTNTGGTSLGASNGGQTTTYSPPATATTGTVYYYAVMTATGGGCNTATTSIDASVTVVAQPALTSPTPASETVCTNGAINALSSTPSGGTGTITYQWYSAASNVNTGGASVSGAVSTSYTPPSTATTGTTYYYVVMTATGSGCNSASSALNDASVTVVAQPSLTNPAAASQTVCTGATVSLTTTGSNGTGTTTYTWYNNSSNNSTSGGTAVGSNSASYSPGTSAIGGPTYYYVTYGTSGSGCITATATATASVTVVAQPTITANPTPASQSLCVNGTPTNLSATGSGGTGTATYQWVNNGTTNSESGGTNVGTNSSTYTPPVTTAANTYYYVKYSTSGTGCNTAVSSATANVTVVALPSLSSPTPALQSLCASTAIGSISTALSGGTGTISYQWFEVGSNTNTGGTAVSGATSGSFTPATISTAGAYYYYATVTATGSGCGSATSALNDAEVAITAGAPGTPSFTGSQSVSEGNGATAYTVSASNTASYTWAVPSGWSASTTSGTSSNLTPPTAADGITYGGSVNVSVTATNACNTTAGTYPVYVHGSETWAGGAGYSFTMPSGMSSPVTITMSGGGGGAASNGGSGGAGAKLTCTYSNVASASFTLYVGGAGSTSSTGAIGGYNGGGYAYEYYAGGWPQGGGGGGATDVYVNSAEVLIAGGGGGASYNYRCNAFYTGGAGGGLNATAGAGGNCNNNNAGGGTEAAGGASGNDGAGSGTAGGSGYGGEAGVDNYGYGCGFLDFSECYDYSGGGGGGAGYYGGGGGSAGAGGGGSSYPTGNTGNISGLAITGGGGSGSGANGYCTIVW